MNKVPFLSFTLSMEHDENSVDFVIDYTALPENVILSFMTEEGTEKIKALMAALKPFVGDTKEAGPKDETVSVH